MTDDTVSWYITFGFGGPHGGQYTEILVPADLPRDEQQMRARMAAFAHYDKVWAFDYGPDQFERSIKKYGMTLRETIDATGPAT